MSNEPQEKLCKNCRFYNEQPPNGQWVNLGGLCGRIYDNGKKDGVLAETITHWGDDSGLVVSDEFGCIEFKSADRQ